MRDAVAELAERAQVISHEAQTKVTAAMRDAIGGAAGVAGFALESARDLVQYLVRRGQMTVEEGERLIREAEATHAKRGGKRAVKPAPKPAVKPASNDKSPKAAAKKPKAKAKAKAKKR